MVSKNKFNLEVNIGKQLLSSEIKIYKTESFFYQTKKIVGIDNFVLKIAESISKVAKNLVNQNNKIKIEHEDKTYTYEVFSVYVQDASKDFLKFYFDSYDEYEDYLNYIKSKSLFKSNVDVSTDDSIISLYTCSYEFDGARTIVNGKLISVE